MLWCLDEQDLHRHLNFVFLNFVLKRKQKVKASILCLHKFLWIFFHFLNQCHLCLFLSFSYWCLKQKQVLNLFSFQAKEWVFLKEWLVQWCSQKSVLQNRLAEFFLVLQKCQHCWLSNQFLLEIFWWLVRKNLRCLMCLKGPKAKLRFLHLETFSKHLLFERWQELCFEHPKQELILFEPKV